MGSADERIRCRKCREEIPYSGEHCPNCGRGFRSTGKLIAVAILGAILAVASFWNIGRLLLFFLIGLVMIVGSGYLLYDKRRRRRGI